MKNIVSKIRMMIEIRISEIGATIKLNKNYLV